MKKNITTVRELAELHPNMYDYNYKWKDCENPESEREISEVLAMYGYRLSDNDSEIAGDYNDLKGYLNCEIAPL